MNKIVKYGVDVVGYLILYVFDMYVCLLGDVIVW